MRSSISQQCFVFSSAEKYKALPRNWNFAVKFRSKHKNLRSEKKNDVWKLKFEICKDLFLTLFAQ